jgi:MFS family permease
MDRSTETSRGSYLSQRDRERVRHVPVLRLPGWNMVLALGCTTILSYGAAFGALSPLRAQVMADHFGKQAYGAITGLQGIPLALCQAAGPLVAGWLFDTLHHYDLAFWLCVGSFVVAALLLVALPQPGRQCASG